MVPLTQWTWAWANSGRQWRTGKPGVLQSMGRKESDTTEQLNIEQKDWKIIGKSQGIIRWYQVIWHVWKCNTSRWGETEWGRKNFEEIIAQIFPNLMKVRNMKFQWTSWEINKKILMPKNITDKAKYWKTKIANLESSKNKTILKVVVGNNSSINTWLHQKGTRLENNAENNLMVKQRKLLTHYFIFNKNIPQKWSGNIDIFRKRKTIPSLLYVHDKTC